MKTSGLDTFAKLRNEGETRGRDVIGAVEADKLFDRDAEKQKSVCGKPAKAAPARENAFH